MRDGDAGLGEDEQRRFQEQRFLTMLGASSEFDDLLRCQKRFERALAGDGRATMQHLVLITDMAPTVLCSSAFSPDYDFEGHRLQDLGDYAAPADTMFLSSVATDAGGAFVLSWWDGDRAPLDLASSLLGLRRDRIPDALLRLMFVSSENIAISPSWWDSLAEPEQSALRRRFAVGLGPMFAPTAKSLADDGSQLAPWSVVANYELAAKSAV